MVKIIENYSLHEQIGQGEYGKVYRAIDGRNKREVAVKVINVKKFKQYPKLEQCTLNQIEILSKIDCPHIIKFIEILKTANNFYFFYQFCNDGTLQDKIKSNGPLPQTQALQYFEQIIDAFRVLSSKNIMHRDLKPSNILFNEGKIKLADFGFCKTLQNQRDLAQTMLGSPIYMAPEVLKGQIYTVKADIWSLGVVLYQMLYGFCPFQERSIARLINLLQSSDLVFNSEINRVSANVENLIRRMLVKDHFKRMSWEQILSYNLKEDSLPRRYSNLGCDSRPQERIPLSEKPIQEHQTTGNKGCSTGMFKKKANSNNQNEKYVDDSSQIWAKSHEKLLHYIKVVYQVVAFNYCPELTGQLAVKLYLIIQKEHYKLPMKKQFSSQRARLNEVIKLFQEAAREKSSRNYSGPLLSQYIRSLQSQFESSFGSKEDSKDLVLHCLHLLDMNELGNLKASKQYKANSKEYLLSELNQRLIRNTL